MEAASASSRKIPQQYLIFRPLLSEFLSFYKNITTLNSFQFFSIYLSIDTLFPYL